MKSLLFIDFVFFLSCFSVTPLELCTYLPISEIDGKMWDVYSMLLRELLFCILLPCDAMHPRY